MSPRYDNQHPPILDPNWRYVPSHATDIGATFKRVREQQERAAQPCPLKDAR